MRMIVEILAGILIFALYVFFCVCISMFCKSIGFWPNDGDE